MVSHKHMEAPVDEHAAVEVSCEHDAVQRELAVSHMQVESESQAV